MEMIDTMMKFTNASYVVYEPPDGQWGSIDENGNWTGLVGKF